MDISLLTGQRTNAWSATMINLEARKLINTANMVASHHLQDGLTKIKFMEDIKSFISRQFSLARQAKSDEEGVSYLKNLRAENESLLEQDRLLKTRAAQLYAKVEFIKENNKIVGYVITAVNVVLAGLEVMGGFAIAATGTPIGAMAGVILIADGFNTLSREFEQQVRDKPASEGIIANGAMATAEFMGFSRDSGLGAFKAVSLAANAYSIFGLLKRPGTWRLFHYIPTDFYRKVETMNRPMLTMKIVGYGLKAKVVFDLMTTKTDSAH
ncbi:DUF4225 domain-containing protein [Serratia ficaria]|uniref:DUF4225 domain-containing protein n=1 Tax=Serratia ficaria TaxID=61651 RepID=UPI00217C83DF|nr:DUF4225 domain-containing protein [Serratia ficaria]MEE4482824.1 DUF4225 domain-containing protein [Serratia ficaria]CAI0936016.1 Uncharacterised protein [Serratia ficaria]CAI1839779.1 Uncharacterised protein [Serratia ficaria]CAI2508518.1 Uncharacterised protein [Serratia ficaria]